MRKLNDFEYHKTKKDNRTKVGTFIKRKREKNGASQKEVAEQLRIDRSEISNYETGSRDIPFSSFAVLGECLDFTLSDYVLDRDGYDTISLFENAIYRETGADKPFEMGYVSMSGTIRPLSTEMLPTRLSEVIRLYFDGDAAGDAKQMLVLADMLWDKLDNKSVMGDVYKHIVNEISNTGDFQMDALFREYIWFVRNNRENMR